jgi:hypothetical protein
MSCVHRDLEGTGQERIWTQQGRSDNSNAVPENHWMRNKLSGEIVKQTGGPNAGSWPVAGQGQKQDQARLHVACCRYLGVLVSDRRVNRIVFRELEKGGRCVSASEKCVNPILMKFFVICMKFLRKSLTSGFEHWQRTKFLCCKWL